MKHSTPILVTLIALMATACGATSAPRPMAAPQAPAEGAQSPAAAEKSAGPGAAYEAGDEAAPSSAPPAAASAPRADADSRAARGGAYESERPAPEQRPGLATRWGEGRESHVTTAPFVREDSTNPFAAVRIFYNDAEGVRAMAARSGISDYGDNVAVAMHSQLTVRILDASGNALPGFTAGGRTYVAGEDGERYIIQIRNHTGNRVEAVATVDGLDVIDGRPGAFTKRGYVVSPFATVEIEGFRRSAEEVASFRFGSVSESYAARKGDDRNVGVVGVAFFQESGSTWPWTDDEVDRRHEADPFPGRYADPPPRW
jgi:hypothetical protein